MSAVAESTKTKRFAPENLVRELAYKRWIKRGRVHGHHVADWLEAERLVHEHCCELSDQDWAILVAQEELFSAEQLYHLNGSRG